MPLSFQINLLNEQNNADKRQFLYLELYKLYLNSQVSWMKNDLKLNEKFI